MFSCAYCGKQSCEHNTLDSAPKGCPSIDEAYADVSKLYDEKDYQLAQTAALVEASGYCKNTRVEEIMDFAHRMGMKRLGLAFCGGLKGEALIFAKILEENGFEVITAMCKMGGNDKQILGIKEEEKIHPNQYEPMCNPIAQAKYLDDHQVDLAIIMGLCVGHDTLFIKHVKSPTTVLAVKDRVLGHNPLAALYLSDSYYRRVHSFLPKEE